ncbi:MAG: DNA repair protein RecO [Candidatus Daviesbacteria bacterium]|nr:DNA repair protein RecO [Candidatus Daviesbacteria bacterium]
MPTFTTEGIVIRRSNYGEAGRLLTVMTPMRGKIRAVAKGVRRITSRRGGNVELLNKVRLQFFLGKGMMMVTEADSIETYPKIKSDLVLTSYASHAIELIDNLVPEGQVNNQAYNLLAAVLQLLEKNPRQVFIRAFEVKILSAMGFWSAGQTESSQKIQELLNTLENGSWKEISDLEFESQEAVEVEHILRYYIERILEKSLKSLNVYRKMKEVENGE